MSMLGDMLGQKGIVKLDFVCVSEVFVSQAGKGVAYADFIAGDSRI